MAKYRVIESVSVADQTFEVGAEVELEEAVAQPLVDEGKLEVVAEEAGEAAEGAADTSADSDSDEDEDEEEDDDDEDEDEEEDGEATA